MSQLRNFFSLELQFLIVAWDFATAWIAAKFSILRNMCQTLSHLDIQLDHAYEWSEIWKL